MKSRFFIISLLALLPIFGRTQYSDDVQKIKKNLIYGSAGTILFKSTFNLFYERNFIRGENGSFGARIGGGVFQGHDNSGANLNAQLMMHLRIIEFGAGFTYRDIDDSEILDGSTLGINLGVRLYTKKRNFIFRSGISLPEGVYLSVGFCFDPDKK